MADGSHKKSKTSSLATTSSPPTPEPERLTPELSRPYTTTNLNPWTEAKVNSTNPAREPMLIMSGEQDHTVPPAISDAIYGKQKRNACVTEFVEMPSRGHSLTIDDGSREVADTTLTFIKRFP